MSCIFLEELKCTNNNSDAYDDYPAETYCEKCKWRLEVMEDKDE